MKEEVRVGEFVQRLMESRHQNTKISPAELLRYGHFRGWLEDQDERYPDAVLNRQSAARILHQFLRLECGLPDLADISPALKLRDLYTCRACAEHIAQIYTRGLMQQTDELMFFNHLAPLTKTEAQTILEKLFQLIS